MLDILPVRRVPITYACKTVQQVQIPVTSNHNDYHQKVYNWKVVSFSSLCIWGWLLVRTADQDYVSCLLVKAYITAHIAEPRKHEVCIWRTLYDLRDRYISACFIRNTWEFTIFSVHINALSSVDCQQLQTEQMFVLWSSWRSRNKLQLLIIAANFLRKSGCMDFVLLHRTLLQKSRWRRYYIYRSSPHNTREYR